MSTFNLADALLALGNRYFNRTAIVSGERELTYGELSKLAVQAAHQLTREGVEAGANVGLALRDPLDVAVHLFALWMIDAIGVVIDFRAPASERAALAEEFDLVLVLADTQPANAPYRCISIHGEWQEQVAGASAVPPSVARHVEIAAIGLTSGTTGRPLGLLVRHDDTLKRIVQNHLDNVAPYGTQFLAQPIHYSATRNIMILRLIQGWTVVMHPPLFSIEELAEAIIRVAPDTLSLVPTVVRSMINFAQGRSAPLFPGLKQLNSGGAPTSASEKLAAVRLLSPNYREVYSSGLCANISTLMGDDITTHSDTVGRIGPLVRLEVVDENDNLLPNGEIGQIRVRTPAMVSGTYKNQFRPAGDRFKDGWIYLGDLGSLGADGFLRLTGRSSDVIIRGGANVHPSQVEAAIAIHPGVRAVAVTGYSAAREGEEIAAVVVSDGSVAEADLVALCRGGLPPDQRPRRFLFIDALPQTSIGKPDRRALRALVEASVSAN